MQTFLKRFLGVGLLATLVYALWRTTQSSPAGRTVVWEPQPFPYPPRPRPTEPAAPAEPASRPPGEAGEPAWVEAVEGACPATHPVKGKLTSGIFHEPGTASYARTRPDR